MRLPTFVEPGRGIGLLLAAGVCAAFWECLVLQPDFAPCALCPKMCGATASKIISSRSNQHQSVIPAFAETSTPEPSTSTPNSHNLLSTLIKGPIESPTVLPATPATPEEAARSGDTDFPFFVPCPETMFVNNRPSAFESRSKQPCVAVDTLLDPSGKKWSYKRFHILNLGRSSPSFAPERRNHSASYATQTVVRRQVPASLTHPLNDVPPEVYALLRREVPNATVYWLEYQVAEGILAGDVFTVERLLANVTAANTTFWTTHLSAIYGYTLTHLAAQLQGPLSVVFLSLFKDNGATFTHPMRGSFTHLHLAVERQNALTVQWLLENNAYDLERTAGEKNETVLFTAVRHFKADIFSELIQRGARVNTTNIHRETPLHIAIRKQNYPAINALLKCDVPHAQINTVGSERGTSPIVSQMYILDSIFVLNILGEQLGMTVLITAIVSGDYQLVEQLVHHTTFWPAMTSKSTPVHSLRYISHILEIVGRIHPKTFSLLMKVETTRSNVALCARGNRLQSPLWKLSYHLLRLPASHRSPEHLKTYAQTIHMILNFFTYARIARLPGYKSCNPHATGYLGEPHEPKDASTSRIALEFLLDPHHPLSRDLDLIRRFYFAVDPANENTLAGRLARHKYNMWSFVRVVRQKPEALSIRVFLLGRSNHQDGCAVAVNRQLWPAVKACADVLRACLTGKLLPAVDRDSEKFLSSMPTPKSPTGSGQRHKELYAMCVKSYERMVTEAARNSNSELVQKMVSHGVPAIVSILSNTPITDDRQAQDNLYFLNALTTFTESFEPGQNGLSPLENAFMSYQADTFASSLSFDMHYLQALLFPPFSSLTTRTQSRKAMQLLGLSAVYGFTRPSQSDVILRNTLLDMKASPYYALTLLRHPPVHHDVFSHFPADAMQSEHFNASKPALILITKNLVGKPFADSHVAHWAMQLLGVNPEVVEAPARGESTRPSDDVFETLRHRRDRLVEMTITSPSSEYDPAFVMIEYRVLIASTVAFGVRLLLYALIYFLARPCIFGSRLSAYTALRTVDFWEMVYPAYSGVSALLFAFSRAFLAGMGTRHHPWGFLFTSLRITEMALTSSGVICLYVWSFGTGDWHYLAPVLILQAVAFATALLSTLWMKEKGSVLLIANLCPCSETDLAQAVFLSPHDLTDWHYAESAGLTDENSFNTALLRSVRRLRLSRCLKRRTAKKTLNRLSRNPASTNQPARLCTHGDPVSDSFWTLPTDENIGDAFWIARRLAEPSSFCPSSEFTAFAEGFPPISDVRKGGFFLKKRPIRRVCARKRQRRCEVEQTSPPHKPCRPRRLLLYQSTRRTLRSYLPRAHTMQQPLPSDTAPAPMTFSVRAFPAASSALPDALPRVEHWKRVGVAPPAFLEECDTNKYLGPVRCPKTLEERGVFESVWNSTASGRDTRQIYDGQEDTEIEQFLQPVDLLRIQRQQRDLFDCGAIDLGHLPRDELQKRVVQMSTTDFLPLFHHIPALRRFASRVFFAGSGDHCVYVLIVILLEASTFICSIAPLLITNCAPRRYHIAIAAYFRNSFLYLLSQKTPSVIVVLGLFQSFVSQRLLTEIVKPAAIHMLLSCHAFRIGKLFTWKAVHPYLALKPVEMLQSIWSIRRIACRRLDNMVELTKRQFDTIVLGLMVLYLPFIYALHSVQDKFFTFHIFLCMYLLTISVSVATCLATLFGYFGYQSLLEFAKMGHWLHRAVDPVRSRNHPLVCLAGKNDMDPSLRARCFGIVGFRITSSVMILVWLLTGVLSITLGRIVYHRTFPNIYQPWDYTQQFLFRAT